MDDINVYIKNKKVVLGNTNKDFVYEVCVNCYYRNYFSMVNNAFYSSKIEIPKVVRSFFLNPHAEITCELYSAPLTWLLDNGYIKYIKIDKKLLKNNSIKNVKPEITVNRRRSR